MKINSLPINKLDFLIFYIFLYCYFRSYGGGKTFPLLNTSFINLNASVAIFLLPLVFSINDVITEVYGAKEHEASFDQV